MNKENETTSNRKNFLLVGISALFSAIGFKYFTTRTKKTPETVKMLTETGILVEIDKNIIAARGKKVTNNELKNWIKNPLKNINSNK